MKKFFVIPGFKQKHTDKSYLWLKKFLSARGFDVVCVPIEWNRRTMSDYIVEFEDFYNKNKADENYVLGFSYGAVITFITAHKLKPSKIFLCSLSPDFKEDLTNTKQWILDYIGKRRTLDAMSRSGKVIAKNLTIPSVVFYGEKEGEQYPKLKNRCEETVRLAQNSKLVIVKDSPHIISYPRYMEALKQELQEL